VKVRLLIQNESQQALFNLHIAVVFDQAQLPKLVQEYVHAAPRGSITGNCRISRHRGFGVLAEMAQKSNETARMLMFVGREQQSLNYWEEE
jgi:hypothetical protein